MHQTSPELMPSDLLAYLGDAVFELMVRGTLLQDHPENSGALHRRALRLCSARGQAACVRALLPLLTEQEAAVYRRARNAKLPVSKKGDPAMHSAATGLEALFGLLHLQGDTDRLRELFAACLAAGQEPAAQFTPPATPEPQD